METGTLKELNVKPGDVVANKNGEVFETVLDEDGRICDKADMCRLGNDYEFTLVSRAPTPDLTAITTPFGLLDEATQEALRAHGGTYEYWYSGEWIEGCNVGNLDCWAWRVQPQPADIRETEYMTISNVDGMLMKGAWVETVNGRPDWSTFKVAENG